MIPRILVIDDCINLPRFIAMELYAAGYQVSIHCNDLANLSIVQELKPNLIVLNWELRCRSSSEVFRQLRLMNHQVPIIIMTVKDENSCRLALQLGVWSCLTKPFSMKMLLSTIEYHLNDKKQVLECSI